MDPTGSEVHDRGGGCDGRHGRSQRRRFDEAKGDVKEAVGDVTGNEDLEHEGKKDRTKGKAKQALGTTKEAAGKAKEAAADAVDAAKDRMD
jgi:uncharacterized protein YjbJ (UPF0337 family)